MSGSNEERRRALEERRAKLAEEHRAAHADQQLDDLEQLVELEERHGVDRVLRIDIGCWKAGAATMVVARIPNRTESVVRRFEDSVAGNTNGKGSGQKLIDATETLGRACIVYPEPKSPLLDATLDIAPGILGSVAGQVMSAVTGKAEEEKKG